MNIREQYAAARKAAQEIHAKATAEGRVKTEAEQAEFDAHVAKANELRPQIERMDADAAAVAAFVDTAAAADPEPQAPAMQPRNVKVRGDRPLDPGALVVESDQFKAMMTPFAGVAEMPKGANPTMAPVSIGSFRNALLTDPELYPVPHKLAPATLDIVDVFGHLNVIDDAPKTVQIDRETFTNNAGVFTEGSDTPKPESTLVYTPDEVTLATIAHHIPVTTQALKYNSILRSRINTRLVNGVLAKAQAEVVATLLAEQGLMQSQAFDTDIATTLRKALTKAQKGIMQIGGSSEIRVLISPDDHETLDLELLDAMVALAGQELQQTSRIWRATVVPVFGLTPGTAYVGDTKQIDFYVGSGGVTVSTGWVDKQFIQNRVTFLAEMDAKAAVIGGAALVAVDLDPDIS